MRSDLRLADLRGRTASNDVLMTVQLPAHILTAIEHTAERLDASKREVLVALLNEGLARVETRRTQATGHNKSQGNKRSRRRKRSKGSKKR